MKMSVGKKEDRNFRCQTSLYFIVNFVRELENLVPKHLYKRKQM